jgi:arylsulfatase A-like enzyme
VSDERGARSPSTATKKNPGDAFVAAAIAAALVEGVMAFVAGSRGGVGGSVSAAAAFESFGLVALPSLAFALAFRRLARTARGERALAFAIRRLGGDARADAVGGLRPPTPPRDSSDRSALRAPRSSIARLHLCLSVAIGLGAMAVTRKLSEHVPAVGVGAGAFVIAIVLFALVGKRIGDAVESFAGEELGAYVAPGATFLGSLAIFAALAQNLPPAYLFTPGAALLAWTLPALPYGDRAFDALAKRGSAITIVALLAAAVSFGTYARVPASARKIVLSRMPYAAASLTATHYVIDFDRDGWSPVLAGGDCNDFDKTIHPGARDVPDNGIDENCSGSDAHRVPPMPQPPFTMPTGLPTRPSFVLVQLDALRPDHVGFVGYNRPTTPNLDRFRAGATWFSRTYTPGPSTRFAMAALFTGDYLERIPHVRGPGIRFELLPTQTFANRLGEVGYDRIGFTISYVTHHILGMGQGFRTWDTPWPADDWERSEVESATLTTDAALKTLGELPDDGSKPFLLFLHYRCTHDPYVNKPRWDFGSSPMDQYDSAAAYCDDELGRLLKALDERRDVARTATFIFSDHGELFGEHGLEHHGNSLYEPDVRALLVARIPGLRVSQVDAPVSLFDLHTTLLSLGGAPIPASTAGWNLLPLMTGGDAAAAFERRPIFMFAQGKSGTAFHESLGVVLGRQKLIRDLTSGGVELFDVIDDPEERDDLAPSHVQRRVELDDLIEGH